MSDESVVVEEFPSSVQEEQESVDELANFSYENYTQFLPPEVGEKGVEVLKEHKRGWKTLARKLLIIAHHSEYLSRIESEITDLLTREVPARTGTRINSNRDRLRIYFNNMNDDALQKACTKLSVSYTSFMSSNDKQSLVEALCDEMESL